MNLIIHGINGNMGRFVKEISQLDENINLVAGIDSFNQTTTTCPVFKSIADCTITGDIIVDFSHYSLVADLLDYVESNKIPTVICTTGLTPELIARIEEVSQNVPLFLSGNMSLGINLLISLVRKAAKILDETFDIEIIEKHHNKKVDAPSGTAFMIANEINDELNNSKAFNYGRSGNNAKRSENEIGIHAVRGGSIVGEHTVLFAGPDETIEIKHNAQSKKVFAEGAVKAAKFLVTQSNGLYEMNDIFN